MRTKVSLAGKRTAPVKPAPVYVYCGQLLCADGDLIDVSRFIVKEAKIAFELVTSWGEGVWNHDGVAELQGNGTYLVKNLVGHQIVLQKVVKEFPSVPCSITFRIEKQSDREIQVTGEWEENNERYHFKGTLRKFSPPKPGRNSRP